MKISTIVLGLVLSATFSLAYAQSKEQSSTTTQEAAEAKQREGKTGTSNKVAADALKRLDDEEKREQKKDPEPKK